MAVALFNPTLGTEQVNATQLVRRTGGGRIYLVENEIGRITSLGAPEPVVIFDQLYLPYSASRTGGESIYQYFPRWKRPPRKIYTGRRLYRFVLSGAYRAEDFGGVSPFSDARVAQDSGNILLLKVNQRRNAPTVNIAGLTPAPFDPLPKLGAAVPNLDAITVTISSITETPRPDTYLFNTPAMTDWVMNLEEDVP